MSQKSAASQYSYQSNSSNSSTSNTFDVSDLPLDADLEKLARVNSAFVFDPQCVRKKSNWSKSLPEHKFDGLNFDLDILEEDIHSHSAKLEALIHKIELLDKRDMEKDGKMYKHFIFFGFEDGYVWCTFNCRCFTF